MDLALLALVTNHKATQLIPVSFLPFHLQGTVLINYQTQQKQNKEF